MRVIHLHHLYAEHPHIGEQATLAPGHQAWLIDGSWQESSLEDQDA